MKSKKLLVFFLVTLVVIVAAGIVTQLRSPQTTIEKTELFPDLSGKINQVNRITIRNYENTVELVKSGDRWVVATSAGYPAIFNRVRGVAINLSHMEIVDEKTDSPELYGRLGVEDPMQEDAGSLLLTLYDEQNNTLASIIAGQPRQSSGSKPGLYVRRPGEKTALLVEGQLDISAEDTHWYIRDLINIPSAVVKRVEIAYPDGKVFGIYKESRQQPDFESTDPEVENKSASKIIISRIAKGLEELRADGVVSPDNFTFPENSTRTTYTTFDGIITTLELAQKDNRYYTKFRFSIDEELAAEADAATAASDAANAEDIPPVSEVVANLQERLQGWVYRIPDFKYDALTTSPDELKRAVPGNLESGN